MFAFGSFELDTRTGQLTRAGQAIPLTKKAYTTLKVLVERCGHLVTKEELTRAVWGESPVDDNNLNQQISTLRQALGDGRDGARYIETVPRRGYRFVAEVAEASSTSDAFARHASATGVVDPASAGRSFPSRPAALMSAFVILLTTVALVAGWFIMRPRGTPPRALKTVAVLPFRMLGPDKGDEAVRVGMADAIITNLVRFPDLTVRPTSAVQQYATSDQNVLAAATTLRVDAIFEGTIQRVAEQLRVTAHLVRTSDGSTLWSGQVDGRITELFALQDTIANHASEAIAVNTGRERPPNLGRRYVPNAAAHLAYLNGRYFWNKRTLPAIGKAFEYFQQAIALDPDYAQPYSGMVDCYVLGRADLALRPGAMTGHQAIARALALDDSLGEVHATAAYFKENEDWDFEGAELEFRRAVERNPNYVTAHHWYAYHLAAIGNMPGALREIRRALEIDPLSLIINSDVGHMLYLSRQYDQAVEQYRNVLELDTSFGYAHWRLGEVYERQQRYSEAEHELKTALQLLGEDDRVLGWLGHLYAVWGRHEELRLALTQLQDKGNRYAGLSPAYHLALTHAALGEIDEAFHWLDVSFTNRDGNLLLIKSEPMLDPLRGDSRFVSLVHRMRLD